MGTLWSHTQHRDRYWQRAKRATTALSYICIFGLNRLQYPMCRIAAILTPSAIYFSDDNDNGRQRWWCAFVTIFCSSLCGFSFCTYLQSSISHVWRVSLRCRREYCAQHRACLASILWTYIAITCGVNDATKSWRVAAVAVERCNIIIIIYSAIPRTMPHLTATIIIIRLRLRLAITLECALHYRMPLSIQPHIVTLQLHSRDHCRTMSVLCLHLSLVERVLGNRNRDERHCHRAISLANIYRVSASVLSLRAVHPKRALGRCFRHNERMCINLCGLVLIGIWIM